LRDGRTATVKMTMRDAMRERDGLRLHDGQGNPPGRRPGFILGDRARDGSHYAEYDFQISRRYLDQDDPPTGAGSVDPIGAQEGAFEMARQRNTDLEPAQSESSKNHQQRMARIYADYDKTLQDAWRGRK
jgi:hypothetical protein